MVLLLTTLVIGITLELLLTVKAVGTLMVNILVTKQVILKSFNGLATKNIQPLPEGKDSLYGLMMKIRIQYLSFKKIIRSVFMLVVAMMAGKFELLEQGQLNFKENILMMGSMMA